MSSGTAVPLGMKCACCPDTPALICSPQMGGNLLIKVQGNARYCELWMIQNRKADMCTQQILWRYHEKDNVVMSDWFTVSYDNFLIYVTFPSPPSFERLLFFLNVMIGAKVGLFPDNFIKQKLLTARYCFFLWDIVIIWLRISVRYSRHITISGRRWASRYAGTNNWGVLSAIPIRQRFFFLRNRFHFGFHVSRSTAPSAKLQRPGRANHPDNGCVLVLKPIESPIPRCFWLFARSIAKTSRLGSVRRKTPMTMSFHNISRKQVSSRNARKETKTKEIHCFFSKGISRLGDVLIGYD